MALNIASGVPADWDWQLGSDTSLFFGGMPPNVVTDSAGVQWCLGALDGWDSPDLRRSEFDRLYASGSSYGTAYFAARALTGKGMLIAPDQPTLEDAMERLRLALPLNEDVPLIRNETVPKYLMVRRSGRIILDQLGFYGQPAASFDLGMVAGDPRKYALIGQDVSLTSLISGSGAAFPWVFPLHFGGLSSVARVVLRNSGTAPAPVKISLIGPLSSPLITDSVSGYRLRLNMDLLDGQRVDIDTELGSVLLDGESFYNALADPVLEPFTIAPRAAASVALIAQGAGRAVLSTSDTWQ